MATTSCPICKDTVPATGIAGGDGSHRMCLVEGMKDGLFKTVEQWEQMSNLPPQEKRYRIGTTLRLLEGGIRVATGVVRSDRRILQVYPSPKTDFENLEAWREAWPGTELVEVTDEMRKAEKVKKQKEIEDSFTPDEKLIFDLYELYGFKDHDESNAVHLFAQFQDQMVPIMFSRKRGGIIFCFGNNHMLRKCVRHVAELMLGSVLNFWVKPSNDSPLMVPAERQLKPAPDQKIVYLSYYLFSSETQKAAKLCRERGYFVYLRERNSDFQRKMYDLVKEPNVKEVVYYCSAGVFYRARDFEKTPTKDLRAWL